MKANARQRPVYQPAAGGQPRKEGIAMFNLFGKNALPSRSNHLCRSCSWGQWMTGYRESEKLAVCTRTNPNLLVPFAMQECSEYRDKHRPEWGESGTLEIDFHAVDGPSEPSEFPEPDTFSLVERDYPDWDKNTANKVLFVQ
jgi:hypothetical protein